MSELNKKHFDDLDITSDELDRISIALKNDEFKKLFFNYCQELQDPENRKIFEQEIIQLEAERGVHVTFLNPIPGFVVKTSVDGKSKGFINIAQSDKIDKPKQNIKFNEQTGRKGINWSIPYSQAPASRYDYDNRNEKCLVYDVLFHPEALKLADQNSELRKHIINIACEAVEREFNVKLDQTNLKFPKMKFKGIPRPTVIRKIIDDKKDYEKSPFDEFLPAKPTSSEFPIPTIHQLNDKKPDDYVKPKYIIKHRRGIDYCEMTNELDAKLNVTIPKELIIEIELPLLKSTSDCKLDVTKNILYLISERPAKYQLRITLPYNVNDKNGTAKFDINSRKLIVQLPVTPDNDRNMKDLYHREDSGVECDIKDELITSLNSLPIYYENSTNSLVEILDDNLNCDTQISSTENDKIDDNVVQDEEEILNNNENNFLLDTIEYNYPLQFNCNILDDNLCFVIHIKNVDPQSIENIKTNNSIHIKFISIGSGYYPIHYSFYCKLIDDANITNTIILDSTAEAWDNNVILTLNLSNYKNLKYYSTGLNDKNTEIHEIYENFKYYKAILNKESIVCNNNNNNNVIDISVKGNSDDDDDENSVDIDIKPIELIVNGINNDKTLENNDSSIKNTNNNIINNNKNHKKKKNNKKLRSYSESACDELKLKQSNNEIITNQQKQEQTNNIIISNGHNNNVNDNNINGGGGASRKIRSFSESRSGNDITPSFKGILKHYSRYDRSYSGSFSSMDEQYSCSADMIRQGGDSSFIDDNIPEEEDDDDDNNCCNNDSGLHSSSLSESCKKTVRFSSVIHKQLFRLDSSILGQKKKNQKRKNQKQRALQRRNSEGDSVDYDVDKRKPLRKDASNHDSGVDFAELNKSALKSRESNDSELSDDIDTETKNNYMFHMEM